MPERHSCVCGYSTRFWANMLGHRRQCDSWQEHVRAIRDGEQRPTKTGPDPGRPECPYCGRDFGNAPLMLSHVPGCPQAILAAVSPWEVDRAVRRLEAMLAFEAWCRDNERP